ncbi:hypothetical protein ACQPXS_18680 [Streptomyces sp. CA-142005]|uniref:hypothetical protein n=1 Tax=Streptomyces sp. CA-142005 TaxID=3240052 RepID=UPI003D92E3E9
MLARDAGQNIVLWAFTVLSGLLVLTMLFLVMGRWADRKVALAFDATGMWWLHGDRSAFVAWDTLAAVGIYCVTNRAGRAVDRTLELCPRGEIDPDDPLLWRMIREAEPRSAGHPRLRYRIELDGVPHAEEVCRRWVPPGLWFGRELQLPGYEGSPDYAGHDRRVRERERRPNAA